MGMDIDGESGNYFRANIWSWRPLLDIMVRAGFDVPGSWSYNDGAGCCTRAECWALADLVEAELDRYPDAERFVTPSESMATTEDGRFCSPDDPGAKSAYSVDAEHAREWVTFLRECGEGFEIL